MKDKHIEFIKEMGWTPCEDDLWSSPYTGTYMEGAKMSAEFAYHIETMIIEGVKKDIQRAAATISSKFLEIEDAN